MKDQMHAGAEREIYKHAQILRHSPTDAEDILWHYLKTGPLGYKFRRQHPFGHFILAFYCHSLALAIEVDGSVHQLDEVKEQDQLKEEFLIYKKIKLLRFTNQQVFRELDHVKRAIEAAAPCLPEGPPVRPSGGT